MKVWFDILMIFIISMLIVFSICGLFFRVVKWLFDRIVINICISCFKEFCEMVWVSVGLENILSMVFVR